MIEIDPQYNASASNTPVNELPRKVAKISGVTLLIRHPVCTSSWSPTAAIEKWILRHMNIPMSYADLLKSSDVFEILDVSLDPSNPYPWLPIPNSDTKKRHLGKEHERPNPSSARSSTPVFQSHRSSASTFSPKVSPTIPQPNVDSYVFCVTEVTKVLLLADKMKLAIVVDSSPSMSVVDSGGSRPKVLLSMAIETVFKMFDGLVDSFSVHNGLTNETRLIEPELLVSVIADPGSTKHRHASVRDSTSLFVNDSPPYEESPYVKILMHRVWIRRNNLAAFQEKLYELFIEFENTFLSLGLRNRLDPVEISSMTVPIQNEVRLDLPPPNEIDPGNTASKSDQTKSKNTVGSAFTSLKAGCDALDLTEEPLVGGLVYLTDGVSPGWGSREILPRDICSRLNSHVAFLTVIQVGSGSGYIPGVSYGYVPNHEFLRFLAEAILPGTFLYSDNCPYLNLNHTQRTAIPNYYHTHFMMLMRDFSPSMSLLAPDLPSYQSQSRQPRLQNVVHTENRFGNRNILYYPSPPQIDIPRSRLVMPEADLTDHVTKEEQLFPWSQLSKPPIVDEVLCNYRDYSLSNIRLKDLVSVRQRDGFRLQSVSVTPRKKKPGHMRVEIMMVLPWLNNITIDYRIKFSAPFITDGTTPNDRHSSFPSLWDVSAQVKPFKVELNVLAHYSFAILLLHVQDIQRSDQLRTSLEDKLFQLQTYLHSLLESDEIVKLLSAFNPKTMASDKSEQHLSRTMSQKTLNLGNDVATPSNYWQYLGQLLQERPHLLNTWHGSLILKSTSSQANPGFRALRSLLNPEEAVKARRQVATIYLSQFLSSWSSISLSKTCHVRFVNNDMEGLHTGRTTPAHSPGFVMLLISWETECTMKLSLKFYNLSAQRQSDLIQEVTSSLKSIDHHTKSAQKCMKPIIVCKNTLHPFLVRYQPINESSPTANVGEAAMGLLNHKLQQCASLNRYDIEGYFSDQRWVWFPTEVTPEIPSSFLDQIQQKAFVALYNQRLRDGYLPISELPGRITFYKEISRHDSITHETMCYGVQYVLIFHPPEHILISEVWILPIIQSAYEKSISPPDVTRGPLSDFIVDVVAFEVAELDAMDQYLLSQLLVFQVIQGPEDFRTQLLQDIDTINYAVPLNTRVVPFKVHLATALRDAAFRMYVYGGLEMEQLFVPDSPRQPNIERLAPLEFPHHSFGWFEEYRHDNYNHGIHSGGFGELHESCAVLVDILASVSHIAHLTSCIFSGLLHASMRKMSSFQRGWGNLKPSHNFYLDDDMISLFSNHFRRLDLDLSHDIYVSSLTQSSLYTLENQDTKEVKLIVLNHYHPDDRSMESLLFKFWSIWIFDLKEPNMTTSLCNQPTVTKANSQQTFEFESSSSSKIPDHRFYRLGGSLSNSNQISSNDSNAGDSDSWALQILGGIMDTTLSCTLHATLLHGVPVWAQDFERVIKSLKLRHIHIDITDYLLVLTLLNQQGHLLSTNPDGLKFPLILKKHFSPIIGLLLGDSCDALLESAYFYRPVSLVDLNIDHQGKLMDPVKPDYLSQIIDIALNPLFVSLACEYSIQLDTDVHRVTKEVHDIPSSYPPEVFSVMDKAVLSDMDIRSVISRDSRVVSAKLTVSCWMRDKSDHDPNQSDIQSFGLDEKKTKDLNDILVTANRIVLEKLFSGSLQLLRSSTDMLNMAPVLLDVCDRDTGPVITLDHLPDDLDSCFTSSHAKTRVDVPFMVPERGLDHARKRFSGLTCFGLPVRNLDDINTFIIFDDEWWDQTTARKYQDRYWLCLRLIPSTQRCFIDLFGTALDPVSRHQLLKAALDTVRSCYETVARLLLLEELLRSHYANEYLIPSTINALDGVSLSNGESKSPIIPFDPSKTLGYGVKESMLACASLYERHFPIHWRVPIAVALDAVNSTLQPMAIINRPNMYVISTDSSIHFMKVSIKNVSGPSGTGQEAENIFPIAKANEQTDLDKPPVPGPKKSFVRPSPLITEKTSAFQYLLRIEIFGVDPPSQHVVSDFVNLIENKIMSTTVNIMSSFLARNNVHRLTFTDLDFLCPIRQDEMPTVSRLFTLPKCVGSLPFFLLLLRQALMSCWQALVGIDARNVVRQFYSQVFSFDVKVEATSSTINEFHIGDLFFVCNQYPSRLTSVQNLESSKRTGIATICLTPIGSDGCILLPTGTSLESDFTRSLLLDGAKETELTDGFDVDMSSWLQAAPKLLDGNQYGILLNAWTVGSVSCFLDEFSSCLNDTFRDYVLESHLRRSFRTPLLETSKEKAALQDTLQGFEEAVTSDGRHRAYPITHYMSVDMALPAHVLAYTLSEVLNDVGLKPITFKKESQNPLYERVHQLEESNYESAWDLSAESSTSTYMICGIPRIAKSHSNPTSRRSSVVSEESSSTGGSNRANSTSSLFQMRASTHGRQGSDSSDISSFAETVLVVSKPRRTSRTGNISSAVTSASLVSDPVSDITISRAVDTFTPTFPVYGGRNCLAIVLFDRQSFKIMMYNWKKSSADFLFLRCIKVLTWCQIHRQFQERRALFTGQDLQKTLKSATDKYEKRYSNADTPVRDKASLQLSTTSKPQFWRHQDPHFLFRVLDFICHLGSFDAIHLQKQIVDSLELFFQHGRTKSRSFPVKPRLSSGNHVKARSISISSPKILHEFPAPLPMASLDGMTSNEMSNVLHTIRLIHSASAPIFFSTHRGDLLLKWQKLVNSSDLDEEKMVDIARNKEWSSLTTSTLVTDTNVIVSWFRSVLSRYLTEFIQYLEALGLEILPWDQRTWIPGNVLPADIRHAGLFHINPLIQIDTPSVSMRKVLPSGTILVHCGFYEYFSTINVLSFTFSDEPNLQPNDELEKICEYYQKYTHIVSFAYDFHLRHIAESFQETSTRFPMNVLDVLKAFKVLYTQKARFARNRLVSGKVQLQGALSLSLFHYVLDAPQKYGLEPIIFNEEIIGCSYTSLRPDFRKKEASSSGSSIADDSSSLSYTIVLFVDSDENKTESRSNASLETESMLEYYLLLVNRKSLFPHAELDEASIMAHDLLRDPTKEYIADGYYLHDITTNAERRVLQLLENAGKYFGRDSIWTQLVDGTFSGDTTPPRVSSLDWTGIFLEKFGPHSRTLQSIDPDLDLIFSNTQLPWAELLSLLERVYPETVRILPLTFRSGVAAKHVILLNPQNKDYALHFGIVFAFSAVPSNQLTDANEILNPLVLDIEASAISREGFPDVIEYDQISEVVNTLLYFLWEK